MIIHIGSSIYDHIFNFRTFINYKKFVQQTMIKTIEQSFSNNYVQKQEVHLFLFILD